MKQVAQMLGVEIGEIFYIKNRYYKYRLTYRLTEKSIEYYDELNQQWSICDYIILGLLNGDDEIIKKPILDEVEREYLDAVVKPFRNKVISITKLDSEEMNGYEYICIEHREVCNERYFISLPCFKKGTIYKGMETDKAYSMEDMGL